MTILIRTIALAALVSLSACLGQDGSDGEQGPPGEQGATGERGEQGLPGEDGADGADGMDGADGDSAGVRQTLLCQADDSVTFLNAYFWDVGGADVTKNIGVCTIQEGDYAETTFVIGSSCILFSKHELALIYLDFSVTPPVLTGGMTGTMNCL